MSARKRQNGPYMVVPISGVDEKSYPFRFDVTSEELGLSDSLQGNVNVEGELERVGGQFHVRGTIEARHVGECDRCLVETSQDLNLDFSLYFRVSEQPGEPDPESAAAGVYTIAPEDHEIALDEEVVQTIRLAIPMKNLCRPDCKGLCPQCGSDRNVEECSCDTAPIDPRWAKLKGLFPEGPEEN